MSKFGVRYLDSYIPEGKITVDEYLEQINDDMLPQGFDDKMEYEMFLKDLMGLESVRIEKEKDSNQMLSGLLQNMFDKNVVKPGEIDVVIVAQEKLHDQKENLGQYLIHKFGMENAYTLNVTGNYCANIDVALHIADSLKDNNNIQNVIIIGATKKNDFNQRVFGTYGILGDAAGVVLMGKQDVKLSLVDNVILSNGSMHDVNIDGDNFKSHGDYSSKCLSKLIEKNNIEVDNIEQVLIQNANPMLISQCLLSLGFSDKKIFKENLSKYGHLDTIDLVINLNDVLNNSKQEGNGHIIAFGQGFAGTYTASLLKLNN